MTTCHTVNDWMNEVAVALRDSDQETLLELDAISRGWVQTSEDRGAQYNLIEAAIECINTY